MSDLYPIILAGGSGTRLWPLSRKNYPKQFIKIRELGDTSLFQKTLLRMTHIADSENIRVVTSEAYKFQCLIQAQELGIVFSESQIIIEPEARNTLAAISLVMHSLPLDSSIGFVTASDNTIEWEEAYNATIKEVTPYGLSSLVIFGITPTCPHTGYGYIATADSNSPSRVTAFKEKPDKTTAEAYIEKWYYWNAGSFLFSKQVFFSELAKWNPSYFGIFSSSSDMRETFSKLPNVSIDYGLLELSDNILMSPLKVYWNDLGSFDAIDTYLWDKEYLDKSIISVESKNNLTLREVAGKKIALIGIEDLLIVDTKDALLIARKWESEKIKTVVGMLSDMKSTLTEIGTTVYRPWGSYTIIDEWAGFKTKRITVLPGKKLSLQLHYKRSEHWVVVSGEALVTIWEEQKSVQTGESVYVPKETRHRLENQGSVDLHIIESQIGDYLEEDDIVRFDDMYGRAKAGK